MEVATNTAENMTNTTTDKTLIYPTKFGDVELREDRLLTFPQGILGFSDCTTFGLSQMPNSDESPMLLLQSVNQPHITFMVADPAILGLEIKQEDREKALKDTGMDAENTQFLTILTMYENEDSYYLTANLKAPVLINSETLEGCQHILASKEYTTQHKL